MTLTLNFPKIQSQQATSISAQQITSQQTSGIDISNIINLMLPVMIIGMMMRAMVSMMSTPKHIKVATTESINPQAKATTAA